jgi:diguanylate cyclase (GGDEF)-like protein
MNAQEQFIDWMVNIPVVFAFIAILLIVFERAYERERFVSFKKTKELEILSTTDALTGLKNRVNLNNDINLLINRYKEVGTIFSVIILDIDHFKTFNDTYGHLKGDECLKTISGILKDATKQKMYKAYRFGGEEFLILLSDTDQDEALKFSQELKETIDSYAIPNINSDVKSIITVSMGISTTSENYNADIDTLLKYADKALYKAKTSGRDKIVCFDK